MVNPLLISALVFFSFSKCDFVRDINDKIKTKFNKTTGEKTQQLNPEIDYQYPGNEENVYRIVEKKWKDYYSCLETTRGSYTGKPTFRQIMEGQYIKLECNTCQRPFEISQANEWKYKPLDDRYNISEPVSLDLTIQMSLTQEMHLEIFNAFSEYSGVYACYRGPYTVAVYILEVMNNQTLKQIEFPDEEPSEPQTKIRINWEWSEWTECTACGVVGKMYKYGICMVSSMENSESGNQTFQLSDNEITTTEKGGNKTKREFGYGSKRLKKAEKFVGKFETGVPCTSPFLPKILFQLKEIRNITKVVVEFCKVTCPGSEIFEVLDSNGRVIETANNSAGIYSSFQSVPTPRPDVERITILEQFGTDVIMRCPGNLKMNIPVNWKIANYTLHPKVIDEQSHGRIQIDLLQRVHIKKLRKHDENMYSCWQRDQLAGTVHLEVEEKFKLNMDHHFILLSIFLVVLTFTYITITAFRRRKRLSK